MIRQPFGCTFAERTINVSFVVRACLLAICKRSQIFVNTFRVVVESVDDIVHRCHSRRLLKVPQHSWTEVEYFEALV